MNPKEWLPTRKIPYAKHKMKDASFHLEVRHKPPKAQAIAL